MNLLDHLFEEELTANAMSHSGGPFKIRRALNDMYNRTESTLDELYGSSNDEAGESAAGDAPFTSRGPRPMLVPTQESEMGFVGLEPPLG